MGDTGGSVELLPLSEGGAATSEQKQHEEQHLTSSPTLEHKRDLLSSRQAVESKRFDFAASFLSQFCSSVALAVGAEFESGWRVFVRLSEPL